MNRMIVVGSPRLEGRCAHLAEEIFETCILDYPEDQTSLVPLSSLTVEPCIGCDACKEGEDHPCIIEDDMTDIREILDEADDLTLVAPVYFAGPSATFKAFLDRLQPYFWTDARRGDLRPATLHIVGEGHDPFGYAPLITCVQSACYTAGFKLETVLSWVGKIDAQGEVQGEPEQVAFTWPFAEKDAK